MKKNSIILILVCVLFLLLVACGKQKDKSDVGKDSIKENQMQNSQDDSAQENEKEEEESRILTGTYKVPGTQVYVDTPNFHMIEEGYSQLFMVNDVKYVAFTCYDEESGTNAKAAFQTTFKKLKDNLGGYHIVNSVNDDIEEKEIDINGISTYCVKGTVDCGTEYKYDAYMYGYSFVFEGYPCSIIGIVQDDAQAQEDIDEITEIVDAMMKSVRNEQ